MSEYLIYSSIVVASTFLLIPTLGEIFSERSGVLNLGIEGMVIASAAGSFLIAINTTTTKWSSIGLSPDDNKILGAEPNVFIGLFAGIVIGMIIASIHAILTITFNRNQIVSGIGLTFFGTGLSGLFGQNAVGKSNKVNSVDSLKIPILNRIPFVGDVFFNQNIIVYLSYLLVIAVWFVLFRTKFGIIVRTTGENPAAASNQGVNVKQVRYISVIFGGAMAGLGGGYLSIVWQGFWAEGMTSSRGWIVIALVIVALWHPILAVFGSYIFGFFYVYQFRFQAGVNLFGRTVTIPIEFLNMLPFVATLLFLVIWSVLLSRSKVKRVIGAPSALTVPFIED
ncbi:MAG: hypothetical protein HeimC2_25160 [Candidatus Heimdallarchaeota archaeon LC_2]|nr:MAG: hypothetical protein HeimC2_25160 [Candidatus Heimdallarchaeota archaeon LC_2]